jgi:hypothetical protein
LVHSELIFDSKEPACLVVTGPEKGSEGERAQIGLIDGTSVLYGKDFFRLGLFEVVLRKGNCPSGAGCSNC